MTYIQIVNKVLRRLRESEVTSVSSTTYSTLIGEFVNEAKREIEDAWNWMLLRNTVLVTTETDTFRYTLTTAGDRYKILHVMNNTQDITMSKAPYQWMNKAMTSNSVSTGTPVYWDLNGQTSGDPNVDLWPIPDGVYEVTFNMIIPQDDLSDDDTELTVPDYPVILRAYAMALSERGEDGATAYREAEMRADNAISDAIALDAYHVPQEMNWHTD